MESPLACIQCRNSKRRCDRTYPECMLCNHRQVICSYPKSRKPRDYQANTQMSLGIRKPSASRSASNTPTDRQETDQSVSEISATDLLATRFLDPDVFHRMRLELPKPDLAVTKAMTDQAGSILDIQEIARSYFDTVHTWMPIISKKQFNENLLNRLSHRRCELFLLILSMKLSCARVSMPKTVLYRTVKQLHSEIESAGVLSVAVLQASILIAIYELGHAMYPAVLLSVGRCARYAAIIGIDKRARPPRTMNLPWMEEEECCRIWWSIVILDRFLNLCDPTRHIVAPDPSPDTYLPVDDAAWDDGTSRPEDAVTISTSSAPNLARFARFAQAAHLLTLALSDAPRDPTATEQLQRTILSLINLAEVEGSWMKWGFCTQMAVCYCAILLLENPSVHERDLNLGGYMDLTVNEMSSSATAALQSALDIISYFAVDSWTCYRTSPFLSHFLYKAATIYLGSSHVAPGGPAEHKLQTLKQALQLVNGRWLAAGVYVSLLERREMILLTQNMTA